MTMPMSAQDNISLARRFFAAIDRHDVDDAASCVDPNVEWVFNGKTFHGLGEFRQMLHEWFRAFPDYKNEIKDVFAGDDHVAVEYIGRGTQQGPLSMPTGMIQPTGRHIELPICDIYLVRNGKFVVGHNYYDTAILMHQLGQGPMTRQAGI